MKLAKHDNKLKTNAEIESQNFGIGDASVVIEILRNRLYKHKIRTLVQEYICNARDAMRECDSKGDVKITAPTKIDPTFKVRDYGPGITPDRMAGVFVLYGSSTKRDTNGQTGGFGIGAKSAWSYTDSFTINTYVDGTQRTYVAHTGVNNNGRLDLISTIKTNEPNGTEIQIAVNPKDISDFYNAITRAIYFWDSGYNLINKDNYADSLDRQKGEFFNKTLELITDDMRIPYNIKSRSSSVIASIDGVAYCLESLQNKVPELDQLRGLVKNSYILHLPNGFLEVSASREEISDSEHTVKNITKLVDRLIQDVDRFIKSQFKGIVDPYKYFEKYNELKDKYNMSNHCIIGDYEIRHDAIRSDLFESVEFLNCHLDYSGRLIKTNKNKHRNDCKIRDYAFDELYFQEDDSIVKLNKRLREYLPGKDGLVLIKCIPGQEKAYRQIVKDLGFKSVKTLDLPVVVKAPRVTIPRDKKEFCIHTYNGDRKDTEYVTLDSNTSKWYYIEMISNRIPYSSQQVSEMSMFLGINICGLSKASVSMVKDNINFKPLDSYLQKYKPTKVHVLKYIATLSKNQNIIDELEQFKGIDNKVINKMLDIYKSFSKYSTYCNIPKDIEIILKKQKAVKDFIVADSGFNKYMDTNFKFILQVFENFYRIKDSKDDIILFINHKTKQIKKGA